MQSVSSKPLKPKTSKAERRALQESQRAAKAAAKGEYIRVIAIEYQNLCIYVYMYIFKLLFTLID